MTILKEENRVDQPSLSTAKSNIHAKKVLIRKDKAPN